MTAGYKNLCAEIPEALHTKVRQRQTESGISLSQYVTGLITKYYEMEENLKMDKDNVRTVAFQVPVELFEQFKAWPAARAGRSFYRSAHKAQGFSA